MARCKYRLNSRNILIRQQFEKLRNLREHGTRKNTADWCIRELAAQWFLAPATIEGIVYSTNIEDDSTYD